QERLHSQRKNVSGSVRWIWPRLGRMNSSAAYVACPVRARLTGSGTKPKLESLRAGHPPSLAGRRGGRPSTRVTLLENGTLIPTRRRLPPKTRRRNRRGSRPIRNAFEIWKTTSRHLVIRRTIAD